MLQIRYLEMAYFFVFTCHSLCFDLFILLLSLLAFFALALAIQHFTHVNCLWAIPCQFSGSGQGTLSNFPEILLKLSLHHMMNICKI